MAAAERPPRFGATRLSAAPPLRAAAGAAPSAGRVAIALGEPLFAGADRPALLAALAAAEAELEADALGGRGATIAAELGGAITRQLDMFAAQIEERQGGGQRLQGEPTATLRALGLAGAFPRAAAALAGGSAAAVASVGQTSAALDAHLAFVSSFSSLMHLCNQLATDARRPSQHKYIAHQLALLYQTINQVRGELKPFKRQVEARFDDIKATTESSTAPRLSEEQASWLVAFCGELRVAASRMPPTLRGQVQPVASMLAVGS
eukprot:PRCOL_00000543-RA